MLLDFELPKWPVGTTFLYVRGAKQKHDATIIGYHIEHDTDTGRTNVTYRISYDIGVQLMVATVARSTVDMAMARR